MDVYNQAIDGDVACAITAAVGGGKHKWSKSHRVPSKLGGVRYGCLRKESWKGSADSMGTERNSGREPRSDIICVEGNGYRPSHKGDGYRVGGGDVHAERNRNPCGVLRR